MIEANAACRIAGCGNPIRVKRYSLCNAHYRRRQRHGDPEYLTPPRWRRPVAERFWTKVNKDGPTPSHRPELGPCWEWARFCDPQWGYGIFRPVPGQNMQRAHRVSWELANGPVPNGLQVLHHCDNPPCVRPDHLFLGTHQDNMEDRNLKGRQSRRGGTKGSSSHLAKLTDAEILEIRSRYYAGGVSQAAVGAEFGIDQTHVGTIVRGDRWANGMPGERRSFTARRRKPQRRALTPEQEAVVKQRRSSGETLRAIAADYGVSLNLISVTARKR